MRMKALQRDIGANQCNRSSILVAIAANSSLADEDATLQDGKVFNGETPGL